MLGHFRPHKEYTRFELGELRSLENSHSAEIKKYENAILKMLTLNLGPLLEVIAPLYSVVGRAAKMQMEIFRSFVLMLHCRVALNNWVDELVENPVLRAIAGFTPDNLPQTSSYYDYINRIVPFDESPTAKWLVQGSRHDRVSAIVALIEFREISPNLTIDTFISDSASDNYVT